MAVALTLHTPRPYLFTRGHFQYLVRKEDVPFLLFAEPHLLNAVLYGHHGWLTRTGPSPTLSAFLIVCG